MFTLKSLAQIKIPKLYNIIAHAKDIPNEIEFINFNLFNNLMYKKQHVNLFNY